MKSGCQQVCAPLHRLRGRVLLALPASGTPGIPWMPHCHFIPICLHPHTAFSVSPLLSLMETLVIGFRPHLKVLLITSAKTCFQIKSHPQTPGEDMEASFWGNHPNCWHLTVSQGRATKPEHHDCSSPTHIKVRKTEKPILRNFLDETIKMITSNKS